MKKLLKILLVLILIVAVAFVGLVGFLTVTEYKPADVETLEIRQLSSADPVSPEYLTILSWNIG